MNRAFLKLLIVTFPNQIKYKNSNYCFLCICPGGSPAKYEWADAAHQARSFGSEWCWDQAEYQLCIWEQDTTWCGPQ